jgi:predicted Ser/Thr protein kinase
MSGARPLPRPPAALDLTRANLAQRVVSVLEPGSGRDPVVMLARAGGLEIVVKDFAPRGWFVRSVLGRFLHAREARAYRALDGHPAVPRFFGYLDPWALLVEYRPGQRMSRRLASDLPPGFLTELEAALREMHARGVAHLDLRHRTNVMIDPEGHPVLIDFASAVCFRPGSLGARVLLPIFAWVDRLALRKWRDRLSWRPD